MNVSGYKVKSCFIIRLREKLLLAN